MWGYTNVFLPLQTPSLSLLLLLPPPPLLLLLLPLPNRRGEVLQLLMLNLSGQLRHQPYTLWHAAAAGDVLSEWFSTACSADLRSSGQRTGAVTA
jgi:hypothetical protein